MEVEETVVGVRGGYVTGVVTLLRSVTLQFNFTNSWRWQLDPSASYTVCSAYQLLTTQDHAVDLIWHKHIPLKVSSFTWRLLRDRLPTRSNLLDRGIVTNVDAGSWRVAITWRHLNIYFYHVTFTALYGKRCDLCLVCRDRTLTFIFNICIILLIRRVTCVQGAPFCN